VTRLGAPIATVYLIVVFLSFCHGRLAARKVAEVSSVVAIRETVTGGDVDFVIAVGLRVLVDVVLSHSLIFPFAKVCTPELMVKQSIYYRPTVMS
jgi:hypothetical protein